MSELSNSLGGSGSKHIIEHGGRAYPISLVTQGVKVAFEKALFKVARETLAEIKSSVDKDYYETKMDALVNRYEQGEFAMESEFGRAALSKPRGSVLLLGLLLGTKGPDGSIIPLPELEVMNLVAAKPEETAAVFRAVIIESFPGVDMADIAIGVDATPSTNGHGDHSPKAQGSVQQSSAQTSSLGGLSSG